MATVHFPISEIRVCKGENLQDAYDTEGTEDIKHFLIDQVKVLHGNYQVVLSYFKPKW